MAIIMDGNGRWAMRRGLPRIAGHRAGVAAVRRVVERAPDLGISRLTLYAFSCDNWRGPLPRCRASSGCCAPFCAWRRNGFASAAYGSRSSDGAIDWRTPCCARSIRRNALPPADCGLHLRVAIDYSSRDAITRAAAGANAALSMEGPPTPDVLGPMLTQALTGESGEVDLLIRTGGETRLSDFLLWECAYAELLFTDRMWPDFDQADLDAALEEFRRRERRFGGVPAITLQSAAI